MEVLTQDQFDNAVLDLVNDERTSRGLNPLSLSEKLDAAADLHSKNMAQQDFFAHKNPTTEKRVGDRTADQRYQIPNSGWSVGENIAAGYSSPASVMQGWMNSTGHRNNILNPNFTHFGFGYFNLENDTGSSNYRHYWTQVFGSGGAPGVYQAETDSPPPPNNPGLTIGTSAGDLLIGTSIDDTLRGEAGNDTINGGSGNDYIYGGTGRDKLKGENGNDRLLGFEGNDVIQGGVGNDVLLGVNPGASNALAGKNEKDILIGNSGADRFVLGQNNKVYYDDRQANSSGTVDYALIRGFNAAEGDRIQLEGNASDYVLGQSGSTPRTTVWLKTSGKNELIGLIQNTVITNLNSNAFRFV